MSMTKVPHWEVLENEKDWIYIHRRLGDIELTVAKVSDHRPRWKCPALDLSGTSDSIVAAVSDCEAAVREFLNRHAALIAQGSAPPAAADE